MKKLLNTLRISCSVIGAVIGAGFISGREIMTFFFGYNRYISSILLFVVLFLLIYFVLRVKNAFLSNLIKKSELLILILNVLVMASMLGATDSLAQSLFGIRKEIPVLSMPILLLSTIICLNGYEKLTRVNSIIVPMLLLVFFTAVFVIMEDSNPVSKNGTINAPSCLSYVALNVFLIQPFLIKIKEEKEVYSPLGVAFISSFILALAIFLFLGVLSEDCIYCDIPLILLANNNRFLYYLLAIIIFIAIFTTLLAVQFPFCGIINGNDSLTLIFVSVAAFAISRIGFYKIVDKIYPRMSFIAIVYYAAFIVIYLFFVLKSQRGHTLNRRVRKVSRCLS